MILLSIQAGMPLPLGDTTSADPMDKPWVSGFYKSGVTGEITVTPQGIIGDGQADLVNHGGLDKAINVYPSEHLQYWGRELGIAMPHGGFGENFTVEGMVESGVCIGDVFRVGEVRVQVSQPRQPCWKLARRWRIKDLAAQVERTGLTGWYLRVLEEGKITAPCGMTLIERPHPRWTIALANEIMHHRKTGHDAALKLASCPPLSASWRESLRRRVNAGSPDTNVRLNGPAVPQAPSSGVSGDSSELIGSG
jgi:MOSC domain-containing protein YiiM